MLRFILPVLACLLTASFAAERPNILYLYVDDMGWGAIGPNGQWDRAKAGKPHVITPNIDRLARQGVNFPFGYGCTVCSPARSSQQTGFHQGHTFADRNDPDNAKKAIRKDDITMGDVLSEAGYTTGYWGKWGYGGSKDMASPTIDNVQTLPTSHGYQHVVAELHHVRAHTFFQPTLWTAPSMKDSVGGFMLTPNSMKPWTGKKHPNRPALQNHPNYPPVAYCDDVYAFSALEFVKREARSGTPFFGLVAFQVPHAPFNEITKLPKWDAAYRNKKWFARLPAQAQQWAAMVTRIDGHIGNLLAALEDPDGDGDKRDSVLENTLVIFQSDNGGPGGSNNQAFDANGGLKGTKGKISEGGIRVPTLLSWPAKIRPGASLEPGGTCERLVDVTDLLPTFCELAGREAPLGIDGVSLVPTITGTGVQRRRDFVIHEAGEGVSVIHADGHKLVRSRKNGKEFLYDVRKDPGETSPLAAPARQKVLGALLDAEHTGEPRGFAVTYHDWVGASGDALDAAHWSRYTYENAGITYMDEGGAPQSHWVARIHNPGSVPHRIQAERLSVLGLGLEGPAHLEAKTLLVRNELRIGPKSLVSCSGESEGRQVLVQPGGTLSGRGRIEAEIHNHGTVVCAGFRGRTLVQGEGGTLVLEQPLTVERAVLAGTLRLGMEPKPGTVVMTGAIEGRFANQRVLSPKGTPFMIEVGRNKVTLRAP